MAKKSRYASQTRDSGGFVALPWAVIDSPAYNALSAYSKVLLIEIARQLRGDNNGMLLCSRAYMLERGWKSNDMLTKCKDELLSSKLIHQTVMGHRPNRASWFAVTWIGLDKLDGYDPDLASLFVRGAYRAMPAKTQCLDRPTGQEKVPLHRPAGQETPALSRPTALLRAVS